MKLLILGFALACFNVLSAHASAALPCPNIEGTYRLSLDLVKKKPIHLDQLTAESCQYTNDASTTLFPAMKNWLDGSEQSQLDRQNGKKLYSYLVKKEAGNNCEYFVLNSERLHDFNLVRKTIQAQKTLPDLLWNDVDLKEYKRMDARTFAINPENVVIKEATVRYGGVYAELEDQDMIQLQSNGDLLTSFKHKSSGVVFVVPMMFTYKSACWLKKIQ